MTNRNETGIKLIAGLGNPGSEYEGTRHNVGFAFIDGFLGKAKGRFEVAHGCSSHFWQGNYAGRLLFLQKPETYMNLSGEAVSSLAGKFGIEPSEVLIVHDDMDLPLGRMRLKTGGGDAGHNGIKSVAAELATDGFSRLRIGIGKMANGHGSADFVLSKFEGDEIETVGKVIRAACEAVELVLRRGMQTAMNAFNSFDCSPEAEKAREEAEQMKEAQQKEMSGNNTTHQEVQA